VTRYRVLLIDDSAMVRLTTAAILEDGHYDISEAASVADGRKQIAGGGFDVVIIDQHLGDGMGTDLIPDVRKLLPKACVVVMSGSAAPGELQGADLVLVKGDDPNQLLALLAEALRR
jgi:two-component system, response regulator RegA